MAYKACWTTQSRYGRTRPASKRVSEEPWRKAPTKTARKGHLATSVLAGGKYEFCAHIPQTKFNPEARGKKSCPHHGEVNWLTYSDKITYQAIEPEDRRVA
jgi:hypothetical protein